MNKALFVFSILGGLINASDNNDLNRCVSYFDVVSGAEHISYKETPCYQANEILAKVKAEGIHGLKVCTGSECNEYGRLGILTVKTLLARMNEKTRNKN